MKKSQIIDAIAKEVGITKSKAQDALDCVLACITKALEGGDDVAFVGFGSFVVREKAARKGRNPQTGKPIQIAAKKVPVFKPGKNLKDVVNASKGGKK